MTVPDEVIDASIKHNHYAAGARREHQVRHHLEALGYTVVRTAGSKGAMDLIAMAPGRLLFIQVKSGLATLPPEPWNRLFDLAWMVGATPVLAEARTRKPVAWWWLEARKEPGKHGQRRQPYRPYVIEIVKPGDGAPCSWE